MLLPVPLIMKAVSRQTTIQGLHPSSKLHSALIKRDTRTLASALHTSLISTSLPKHRTQWPHRGCITILLGALPIHLFLNGRGTRAKFLICGRREGSTCSSYFFILKHYSTCRKYKVINPLPFQLRHLMPLPIYISYSILVAIPQPVKTLMTAPGLGSKMYLFFLYVSGNSVLKAFSFFTAQACICAHAKAKKRTVLKLFDTHSTPVQAIISKR